MRVEKGGFLLAEETLKMILALISIGILAFLLFSIYGAREDAKNLELAGESLDHLVQEINAGVTEIEIYNPEGWILMSWPFSGDETLPGSCSNLGWDNCFCMVEDENIWESILSAIPFTKNLRESLLEKVDGEGVCRDNTLNLRVSSDRSLHLPVLIDNPPVILKVDYENKFLENAENGN